MLAWHRFKYIAILSGRKTVLVTQPQDLLDGANPALADTCPGMMFPRKAFGMPAAKPTDFRRRALELVRQGEWPAGVARDSGISESCLRRWMAQDDVDARRKDGLTTDEHRELASLRRRNRVLEMEVEILKRASADFAREEVLPKEVPCSSAS